MERKSDDVHDDCKWLPIDASSLVEESIASFLLPLRRRRRCVFVPLSAFDDKI